MSEYSDIVFAAFGLAMLIVECAIVRYGPALLKWLLLNLYELFIRNKTQEQ